MDRIIKTLFFAIIVKPFVFLVLGVNIRNREKLPKQGPAILAANHNSHLDTLVMMSLYPLSQIHRVRPVAARDYFFSNRILAWLSMKCIGIIPLDRSGKATQEELFSGCHQALDKGNILIIFPEGSRGKPEQMSRIKKGLFYLVHDRPDTTVVPIMLRGLGHALPKGESLLVPFNCDVVVGDPVPIGDNSADFNQALSDQYQQMQENCLHKTDVPEE